MYFRAHHLSLFSVVLFLYESRREEGGCSQRRGGTDVRRTRVLEERSEASCQSFILRDVSVHGERERERDMERQREKA